MQRSVILVVAVLFVVACSGSLSSVPTSISTAASPTPGPSCPPGSSPLVLTVGPGQSVTPSPQVVASYPAPYLYLGPLPSGPPAAPGWVLFVPHTFSPIPGAGSIVAGWLTVWMRPQVDSSADSINVTSPSSGNTYVDSLQVQSVLSQPWTTANYPSYVPVTMPLNSTSLAIVNSTGSLNVVVAYHAQVQAMSLTVCQANPTPTPTTTPVTPAGVATVSGPSTALDNGPVPTPSPTPLPTIVLQWTPKPLPTPTPTPKKSPGGSVVTVIPMPTPTVVPTPTPSPTPTPTATPTQVPTPTPTPSPTATPTSAPTPTPTGACDLQVTKVMDPTSQPGVYFVGISVVNVGSGPCPAGTVLSDPQPTGMTFSGPLTITEPGPSGNWTCSGTTCTAGNSLPPGYAGYFHFGATVQQKPVTNCARVVNQADAVLGNNFDCVTVS